MKNKKWIIWLSAIVVILLGVYFVAGYFLGNLPVASKILGTNKPRDLGVEISTTSATQGLTALHKPITTSELETIVKHPQSYTKVNASLTNEQASSLLAIGNIPDLPLKLTQVRFGDNGRVQLSGVIDVNILQTTLKNYGASGEVMDRIMGIVKNAKYLNIYLDGSLGITNNQISAQLDKLEIGRISLPLNWIQGNTASVVDSVARSLTSSGYNIRSLTINQGQVNFNMDRPLSSIAPWLKFVQSD